MAERGKRLPRGQKGQNWQSEEAGGAVFIIPWVLPIPQVHFHPEGPKVTETYQMGKKIDEAGKILVHTLNSPVEMDQAFLDNFIPDLSQDIKRELNTIHNLDGKSPVEKKL